METREKIQTIRARDGDPFARMSVHLIGIGGSGMRALAQVLSRRGASVTGSDMKSSAPIDQLIAGGIDIRIGQQACNIPADCDIVVHSAAINDQNPELLAARERGLTVLKYSQMLGQIMEGQIGIAVAGTHGKSTTSAMIAYALSSAGADPSYIVGATVEQLGGPSGVGSGEHFVAEACEFDRSFLNLRPHCAAILNVEEDHLDCYADLGAIVEAFRSFASRVALDGVLVVNGEDAEATQAARGASCEVHTFGFAEHCTWRGADERIEHGCFQMNILRKGEWFCELSMSLPGRHNAYNALAAVALLSHAGMESEAIAAAVGGFTGVNRRMTLKGQIGGVTVVDDFAHHPTEIIATLKALYQRYEPKRLLCVFQPHQHSRTRFLLKDFARSFAHANEVIVPDIYFVRDSDEEKDCISSRDLVSQIRLNGGTACYLETFDKIGAHLKASLGAGDLVVTMGAGNIWEVADEIVRWLGKNR